MGKLDPAHPSTAHAQLETLTAANLYHSVASQLFLLHKTHDIEDIGIVFGKQPF